MTRRDQNVSNQQSGYRSEDSSWDSPRQASQWSDTGRQAGGSGDHDDNQRTAYWSEEDRRDRGREPESRYASRQNYGQALDWQDRDYAGYSPGARGDGLREDEFSREFSQGRRFGRDWSRDRDFRGEDRRYRGRGANHLPHSYEADYDGNYTSFTSEDYGGRDFSASRSGGGISGGQHPSDTYRPSYGLGSHGRSKDEYGSWRQYGESRGFLDRAGDEIASWFGDEDAARRREQDHRENHRGRGPSDYTRSDERIREDVNDKLTHDYRVDATSIRVSVKDGEVSLDGTVNSRHAKRQAEDVADEVSGVKHVQNNLRVQDASQNRSSGLTGGSTTGASTAGSTSYADSTSTGITTGARSTDRTTDKAN